MAGDSRASILGKPVLRDELSHQQCHDRSWYSAVVLVKAIIETLAFDTVSYGVGISVKA